DSTVFDEETPVFRFNPYRFLTYPVHQRSGNSFLQPSQDGCRLAERKQGEQPAWGVLEKYSNRNVKRCGEREIGKHRKEIARSIREQGDNFATRVPQPRYLQRRRLYLYE